MPSRCLAADVSGSPPQLRERLTVQRAERERLGWSIPGTSGRGERDLGGGVVEAGFLPRGSSSRPGGVGGINGLHGNIFLFVFFVFYFFILACFDS